MSVKVGGYGPQVKFVNFQPKVQDSTDLEAGTKTITATTIPGTADYSKALTLPSPSAAWVEVLRIAARLNVVRDSGTSANLYCTVTVDSAGGSTNKLFDGVDVQAVALQVAELTSGAIFDLLKDGASHTFYFFFWVDAGDSVISLVQLWEGVGTSDATSKVNILKVKGRGSLTWLGFKVRIGSGAVSAQWRFLEPDETVGSFSADSGGLDGGKVGSMDIDGGIVFEMSGTVATDLNYLRDIFVVLRS